MTDSSVATYQPTDRLHLWLLTQPQQPVLIGDLNLIRSTQGVSLRYADLWLRRGFALSEDLPLIDEEFLPAEKGLAVGAVDDARPDRWGERVIRHIDRPTDDHEKNHALRVTDAQQYELSPAFDVLPSGQALGFQQMRVGEQEADSTLANALSMSFMFSLDKDAAVREMRAVARIVGGWKEHFKRCGVTSGDMDLYAEQIDRPFLRDQRSEIAAG
jgi:serine/threonine-protein kinase HipA